MFLSNELLATLLLMTVAFCYFAFWRNKCLKSWHHRLPGKPPAFLFGNLLDFVDTDKFLSTLLEYKKEYGNLFKIHDGPFSLFVTTADAKFMEFILSSTNMIDKADQYSFFHKWLGTGLLTSTGTKWKKRRKILTPSFNFSILETFIDIFDNVSDTFVKVLNKQVGKSSVNIHPMVTLCTLDIICETAMGIPINALEGGNSEYVKAVKTMCGILVDRMFSPLDPRFFPLTINYYREKRAIKILHKHTESVIAKRRKNPVIIEKGEESDAVGSKKRLAFLDLLLTYTVDGKSLSDTDIREEVDTFMFAGHDTVSSAISFALYALATNPNAQQKTYEEQRRIFGNSKDSKTKASYFSEMKYLENVIKETLRLYPPVPFIGRKIGEDFEWEGVHYPKGLNVMLLNFSSQRDPTYFSDPEEFIPERWYNISGSNPFIYVPFSAGPRNCIGQKFAMLEMKSTISKVIRNFELMPASPKHVLKLASETILVSKNGVCISLKRRS